MELTLHQHPQTRSDRVLWAIHELGLTDRTKMKMVDLTKGDQHTEKYGTINGMRQVPTLGLRDPTTGREYSMTESATIPVYLAEATASSLQPPKTNAFARAQFFRVIALASTDIEHMVTTVVFNEKVAPVAVRDNAAAAKARASFKKTAIGVLEEIFTAKEGEPAIEWVCEPYHKGFTIADCVVGVILIFADFVNLIDDSPVLKEYVARCKERPAYKEMCSIPSYVAALEKSIIQD